MAALPNINKSKRHIKDKVSPTTKGYPAFQKLSHNPQSQQKEARIGLYIGKQAFIFAKYLIMGQALYSGVAWM